MNRHHFAQKYSLSQVCRRLSSGKSISASRITECGKFPVYGANGLRGYTDNNNFSGECAIIGRQGAYCGNVHYFSGDAYMSEHAVVAQPNNLADARYLAYLLGMMNLGRLQGQSAQPGLSVATLGTEMIHLPPVDQQRKVAAVLSSLEKKIEINRRLNDNLAPRAA